MKEDIEKIIEKENLCPICFSDDHNDGRCESDQELNFEYYQDYRR